MYKVKQIKIGKTNVKCIYDDTKSNIEDKIQEIISKYIEEKYNE